MALPILTQVLLKESLVLRPGEFDSLCRLTVQLNLSLVVGRSEKRSCAPGRLLQGDLSLVRLLSVFGHGTSDVEIRFCSQD